MSFPSFALLKGDTETTLAVTFVLTLAFVLGKGDEAEDTDVDVDVA
jgi:hypothetical protein